MKKIFLFIGAAAAAMTVSSCSQSRLEIPQQGTVSESAYYKTDDDCESALAACYTGLIKGSFFMYDACITELLGDDAFKCSSGYKLDDYHTFMLSTYNSTHTFVAQEFTILYRIVYRCNLVIDNFSEGTSSVMKNAVAEAKVLRSWAYIKMISFWGTPPLVKNVPRTSEEMQLPNSTTEELWDFVISSLDEAINSGALTSKSSVNDKSNHHVTKEFAMALKGKAQVFSGDYSGAKTTLKSVMDSGKYALVPGDQMDLIRMSSEGNNNTETLFESHCVADESNYSSVTPGDSWGAYCPCRVDKHGLVAGSYLSYYKNANWGYYAPSIKIIKAMVANEGTTSNRFKAWFWNYEQELNMGLDAFEHYKTAADQTALDAMGYEPSKNFKSNAGKWWCAENCGFWNKKYNIPWEDFIKQNYTYDKCSRRYMRLAEVYLLYAEACAQLGETSGDGLTALNAIATRAGAPTYSSLNMDNVKKEKWFEMFMEGTRFVDLMRWGDGEKELGDHGQIFPVFYGYKTGKSADDIAADGKNIFDVYDVRSLDVQALAGQSFGFRKGQDELLPFPATELANNPNLVQNPGW